MNYNLIVLNLLTPKKAHWCNLVGTNKRKASLSIEEKLPGIVFNNLR